MFAIYINNLLSQLLHTEPKCLSITTYSDNQSLYHTLHSIKQTLKKHLLIDTSAMREMVERNEITFT